MEGFKKDTLNLLLKNSAFVCLFVCLFVFFVVVSYPFKRLQVRMLINRLLLFVGSCYMQLALWIR